MSELELHTGRAIPTVGLGLWKIEKPAAAESVVAAAKVGYRHFDSACDYGNEVEVGAGLRNVISEGIANRDDLFVTSKLWNTYHRAEHVRAACERSLNDLGLDHLDLYLMHFPISLRFVPFEERYPPEWIFDPDAESPRMEADPVPISETWSAMENLVDDGLVRDIGICNFGTSLLRDLLSYARINPAVLQIETHPFLTQEKLIRYAQTEGIVVTAFSPLGAASYFSLGMAEPGESLLEQDVIVSIAKEHNRAPAQIAIRWAVQRGTAVIPKTTRPERLAENLAAFDFELTADQMQDISSLNRNRRFNDPGNFCESAFNTFFPIYE